MTTAYAGNLRVEEFYSFIREREAIRQRKKNNMIPPWTEDPILGAWKFTNVKREHDRTSFMLKRCFYSDHYNAPRAELLFNCAMARYFGTYEFALAVGWCTTEEMQDPALLLSWLKAVARTRMAAGERVFTGAYIITNNGISGPKQDVVCDVFLKDLLKNLDSIVLAARTLAGKMVTDTWNWRPLVERLQQVRGFGGSGFMAKETVLDLAYTGFWPDGGPADRNEWTPVGPGSMRGAARVAGKPPGSKLGQDETLGVCKALFAQCGNYWPMGYPELELTDIQFQLCEFDKYERVKGGEGTPRSRYTPKG